MSQDKNKRQIEVYKAITQLKSAFLDEVLNIVASQLGESSDNSALKRAVRRDLNALVDSHVLSIEYYTPSGDLIPPDEEENHKNTRAKYVVPGINQIPLKGQPVLDKNGMAVICPDSVHEPLNFTDKFNQVPAGQVCISMETGNGTYTHLYLSPEELPLKIYFSRGFEYARDYNLRNKILDQLSRRSILILCSNKSVSRFRAVDFQSHLVLNLPGGKNQIEVSKLISEAQILYAKKWELEKSLGLLNQGDETHEFPLLDFEWNAVSDPVTLDLPSLIKVGSIFVFAQIKK